MSVVLQLTTIASACACFVSFAWAIASFFRRDASPGAGMVAIKILGAIFTAVHLGVLVFLWEPDHVLNVLGLALYLLALLVFWSAVAANRRRPLSLAYSSDVPMHLVSWGPYRYVRHPFYTAYTLAWIAGAIGSGALWLLSTAGVMFGFYLCAALREERTFAASPVAEAYRTYAATTGRFLPRLNGRARL